MNNNCTHLWINSVDITSTARNAEIMYPTFATAALMDRYASEEQTTEGEPRSLWDIVWMTEKVLSRRVPCIHKAEGLIELYWVELFSPVKGKSEPDLIRVQAILDRSASTGARLLLKLPEEI